MGEEPAAPTPSTPPAKGKKPAPKKKPKGPGRGKKPGDGKKLIPPEDVRKLEAMAGIGLNMEEISAILGISKRTLERRKTESQSITDALLKGRAEAKMVVAESAYQQAKSGDNTAMTIFWLKTRGGFTEKQAIELSGPGGTPVGTADLDPETKKALREWAKANGRKTAGGG
jgi:hypothetical protein